MSLTFKRAKPPASKWFAKGDRKMWRDTTGEFVIFYVTVVGGVEVEPHFSAYIGSTMLPLGTSSSRRSIAWLCELGQRCLVQSRGDVAAACREVRREVLRRKAAGMVKRAQAKKARIK